MLPHSEAVANNEIEKKRQYSIQNLNTETNVIDELVYNACTALCHRVKKHSPYSSKIS